MPAETRPRLLRQLGIAVNSDDNRLAISAAKTLLLIDARYQRDERGENRGSPRQRISSVTTLLFGFTRDGLFAAKTAR